MLEIKVNVQVQQLVGALFDGLEPDCRTATQNGHRAGSGHDIQAEPQISIRPKQKRRDRFYVTTGATCSWSGVIFTGSECLEIRPLNVKFRFHADLLG
jgi:hypothetical protein